MEIFVSWASFVGSWLLVAGSIYQASLELKEEDLQHEKLEAVGSSIDTIPKVSAFWWVVPPIKFLKERKRRQEYMHAYFVALEPEDLESFISFTNKAQGWLFVAGGGFLISLKETYELYAFHELPLFVYFLIVVILLTAAIGYTVFRTIRSNQIIEHKIKK